MKHHVITIDVVSYKPADAVFEELCEGLNRHGIDGVGLIAATSDHCSANATSEQMLDQMKSLLGKHTKALFSQQPIFEHMRTLAARIPRPYKGKRLNTTSAKSRKGRLQ